MKDYNYEKLTPFKWFVLQNFPFIDEDFDAITNYQLFCKLGEKINQLIESQNNVGQEMETISTAFNSLVDYVNSYFDNLDIQDEVNNKLDDMAESGELADIIAQYLELQGLLCFDTKNDLKNADNLASGSFTKTYGELSYIDGKGHFYKIRPIVGSDVVDDDNIVELVNYPTLIAEKVLDYYVEKNTQDIEDLIEKIEYNREHSLETLVQCHKYAEFSSLLPTGYAVTAVIINELSNSGVLICNNWNDDVAGTKFDLYTFDFNRTTKVISNFTRQLTNMTGHSNSMCYIDNTHVFIVTTSVNYVYNVTNNDIIANSELPYMTMCNSYKGVVYGAQDYDYNTSTVVNALYEIEFDSNYAPSIKATYNLPDLRDKLQSNEQSFVIYDDLIIFVSFSNEKLCIYDFNTKKYLKTQLFTAPYLVEYESGFVYDDKLILTDSVGQLFLPDIYNKNALGGYSSNCITKSLTDICLLDDPIELTMGANNDIDYNKFMCVMNNNSNQQIGNLGAHLESITIYMAMRTSSLSGGVHNLTPVEIPLYNGISVEGVSLGWYSKPWQASYMEYVDSVTPHYIERRSVCGKFDILQGDSAPKIRITPSPYGLHEVLRHNQAPEILIDETYPPQLYITKIIGHRKVGLGY